MRFSFREPRASKPARLRPGTPLPAPKKSGLERLNNLFGRQRYVRVWIIGSGHWFIAAPAEVDDLFADRTPDEMSDISLRDVYLTAAAFEAMPDFEGP